MEANPWGAGGAVREEDTGVERCAGRWAYTTRQPHKSLYTKCRVPANTYELMGCSHDWAPARGSLTQKQTSAHVIWGQVLGPPEGSD